MSNFLAIASVTAALSEVLQTAVGNDVAGAVVNTNRPDASGTPGTSVNLYLYQVTTNAAMSNVDLPTRRPSGELARRSQVALDLHYLLTFFGDEGKLEPQRLLGSAVSTLHSRPVMTRDLIRQTIAKTKYDFLVTSNLADAIELVKFTPLSLSLEELSKLWSVFFQTPYSLSVAYQGTVVMIESEGSTHAALPVRARNIYVAPLRRPEIETVVSAIGTNEPILSTTTIVINGRRLRGEITQVAIAGIDVTPAAQDLTDTRISVQLPAGVRAGVHGLQVVQPALMGTPPIAHRGVESNLVAFVLHPAISKKLDDSPDVSVSGVTVATDGTKSGDLTLKLDPKAGKEQRATLLMNELNPPSNRAPRAYSFDAAPHSAPADPAETDTLVFPFSGVAPGDYLIRVQIDGADSPLEQSTDVNNPVFVGPTVAIP
ncbi:MAG: DUF4255 domain-containing protein [Pyrinomonadaceae bacterium]|nr:DUF4255 domain-containing protein [Pyrinomonadaceae bacterium]